MQAHNRHSRQQEVCLDGDETTEAKEEWVTPRGAQRRLWKQMAVSLMRCYGIEGEGGYPGL